MNLQELEKQESELTNALYENLCRQREINASAFMEKYGIQIGDTISFMDGKEVVKGEFHKLEYYGAKVNYPYVLMINSDGKVGKRERRCWWSNLGTIKKIN